MKIYYEAKALERTIDAAPRITPSTKSVLKKIIRSAPAADVAPVTHGRWAHLGGDEWCCTNCGFVISTEGSWEKPSKKHCEECGAKMDLEVTDNG